jgi:hypothetical protein
MIKWMGAVTQSVFCIVSLSTVTQEPHQLQNLHSHGIQSRVFPMQLNLRYFTVESRSTDFPLLSTFWKHFSSRGARVLKYSNSSWNIILQFLHGMWIVNVNSIFRCPHPNDNTADSNLEIWKLSASVNAVDNHLHSQNWKSSLVSWNKTGSVCITYDWGAFT